MFICLNIADAGASWSTLFRQYLQTCRYSNPFLIIGAGHIGLRHVSPALFGQKFYSCHALPVKPHGVSRSSTRVFEGFLQCDAICVTDYHEQDKYDQICPAHDT